jgi:MFS family permease
MNLTVAAPPRPATTGRHRRQLGSDWRRLFGAGAVSMLGDGMVIAAAPLFAATLTRDPREVAVVAMCSGLPWLVLSLPAGALTDRHDRRRLMLVAQCAQLMIVSALAALAAGGEARIWMLAAAAFGMGAAETVFRSASEAVLPAIVAPAGRVSANGRQQASMFIAEQSLGPPLGAFLFAAAASLPFWADAVTFAASLGLIAAIRPRPGFAPRSAAQHPRRSALADIAEGMRWLAAHAVIRTLTGLAALANFTSFMTLSTSVLFAEQVLHLDDRGYGMLLGTSAMGGAVGALVSSRIVRRLGLRTTVLVVPFVAPLAFLMVGLGPPNAVLVGLLIGLTSVALAVWNVMSFTLRQMLVPTELLGRVGGAARMVAFGAGPLGSLAGGFLAAHYGLAAPWVVAGGLRLIVSAAALPTLRRQRFSL